MELLDTVTINRTHVDEEDRFRFPVQYVNRPHLDFRGFCGTIASGTICVGDDITVLPSGKTTKVKSIIMPSCSNVKSEKTQSLQTIQEAYAPMAITLTTEDEIDISRGDMIVKSDHLPRISNSLKVMVVWMGEESMHPAKNYYIKAATTLSSGSFEHINYKVDVNTYERTSVDELALNDIASCKLVLNRPIAADPYHINRYTGSFIVIDRITNNTVGAGMIVDVSKRESDTMPSQHREYSQAEIELNTYIRKHYPEWKCLEIS
ncbi:MAG: hypothetical protein EOM50_23835 [Erysipelotrichia bacterium]|nr:hypothetical protein [Erysipelotrichia bacterium]